MESYFINNNIINIDKFIEFIDNNPKEYILWKSYLKDKKTALQVYKKRGDIIKYM
jgi:hypothetical protein